MQDKDKRIAIVGGGLVGALQACFLARRGYEVDVYEKREDIRKEALSFGRSINLALSCRGREALRVVGAEDTVIENGIPMYGRMIHALDGSRHPIPYGKKDQYITSVDRRCLNELLLTVAENYSDKVHLHFGHKLVSCDFDKQEITMEWHTPTRIQISCPFYAQRHSRSTQNNNQSMNSGSGKGHEIVTKRADLVMGCDGAYSAVRAQMMKATYMNYQQEYIPHGYIELCIPPTASGEFAMEINYLHIWPRTTFMLIALPNVKDKSFVLTLFMPFEIFETLTDEEKLLKFFEDKFPDAIPLIGRKSLIQTFFSLKPLSLVSVKCKPFHISDKVVMFGDAAHAMVPFYGQGLNCGFEDLLVFDDLMDQYNEDFEKVLSKFTEERHKDAHTINDLAMHNYIEMRSSVQSKMFLFRKKLDNFLYWMFPRSWIPLYTMVAFTRIRYHECMSRRAWQDHVLSRLAFTAGAGLSVITAFGVYRLIKSEKISPELIRNLPTTLIERLQALRSPSI